MSGLRELTCVPLSWKPLEDTLLKEDRLEKEAGLPPWGEPGTPLAPDGGDQWSSGTRGRPWGGRPGQRREWVGYEGS